MPRHLKPALLLVIAVLITLSLTASTAVTASALPGASPAAQAGASSDSHIFSLAPTLDAAAVAPAALAFAIGPITSAPDAYALAPAELGDLDAAPAPDATAALTTTLPATASGDYSATIASKVPAVATTPSRLELAHARLVAAGLVTQLIVVSPSSTGVALAIYRDLRLRRYRSTTGPDEGIDTRSLACYPACVFVPYQEVNVLTVDRWAAVLRHEYNHVIQARNNPTMAADFRSGPTGLFTSYGLFSEVCADYGIYVAPGYRAYYRMSALKRTLGAGRQSLLDQACQGSKPSYDTVVQTYNTLRRYSRAFAALFPRYR